MIVFGTLNMPKLDLFNVFSRGKDETYWKNILKILPNNLRNWKKYFSRMFVFTVLLLSTIKQAPSLITALNII